MSSDICCHLIVGCSSNHCIKCQRWVHCHCSDARKQVSVLLYWDVFDYRTCPDHNFSVEEKLEFKRGEDVLEEVEKLCCLGDMISCYGGTSEAVGARIGSV